jgi:hypothetical protein
MTDEVHHAPGAIADFTLCGFAYEGECGSPRGNHNPDPPPIVARPGRPITCGQCLQIIRHCRDKFQSEKIRGMYRCAAAK